MSPREIFALRDHLSPELKGRTISDAHHEVSLTDILHQSCLIGGVRRLSGRAVLLAMSGQLLSALAMIELDGVARRMLLCPPDLNSEHIQALIEDADIDAIVTDEPPRWTDAGVYLIVGAHLPEQTIAAPRTERATEWLMLTSGTSGVPKIVGHTLDGLCGAILADGLPRGPAPVWAT
ncbi:MAG TPA: long-chain fatty acid--CoA ligase, partial [Xanthobacteraceae bacterium]